MAGGSEAPPTHTPTHTLLCLIAEGLGQAYGQFWLPDAHLVPSASVSGGNNQGKQGNDCVNDCGATKI